MGYTPRHRSPVERLVAVALDSLAVEVAVAALVHAPAHPALHHGDLVHLGGGEAGVEALLAGDRAEARGAGAARPARHCYRLQPSYQYWLISHHRAGRVLGIFSFDIYFYGFFGFPVVCFSQI